MALQADRKAMMGDGSQSFGFLNDLADQQ